MRNKYFLGVKRIILFAIRKSMHSRKMSLTLQNRSKVKQEIDAMLDSDYQQLRQNQHPFSQIQKCSIVQRTPLIKQYIEQVQIQYNIPSPLKKNQQSSRSKREGKKIDVSMTYGHQRNPSSNVTEKKQPKRLTIVTGHQSRNSEHSNPSKRDSLELRQSLKTPKFGPFDKFDINKVNQDSIVISQEMRKRESVKERDEGHRVNIISSTGKPQRVVQSINFVTPPPTADNSHSGKRKSYSSHSTSQVNEFSLILTEKDTRKTVKKLHQERQYSQGTASNENSYHTVEHSHKNPAKQKLSIKGKSQQQKSAVPDSFRYCVGCEAPILSVNTKEHESSCKLFEELKVLSNQQLLERLKIKVTQIEESISAKNFAINPEQIEQLKYQSHELVKESRSREKGFPESPKFRQNYTSLMLLGNKWCSSLEEINKLRWFTRIISKLQEMISR